jgi:hypothetical protein
MIYIVKGQDGSPARTGFLCGLKTGPYGRGYLFGTGRGPSLETWGKNKKFQKEPRRRFNERQPRFEDGIMKISGKGSWR